MTRKPLPPRSFSLWSLPPTETALPPTSSRKRWRRQYRLVDVGGTRRGRVVLASEDAPADDPDVRRFWNWVAVVFVAIVLVGVLTAVYDLLT